MVVTLAYRYLASMLSLMAAPSRQGTLQLVQSNVRFGRVAVNSLPKRDLWRQYQINQLPEPGSFNASA